MKKVFYHIGVEVFILLLAQNAVPLLSGADAALAEHGYGLGTAGYIFGSLLLAFAWFRIQAVPSRTERDVPVSVKIIYHGRRLLTLSLWLLVLQVLLDPNHGLVRHPFSVRRDFRYTDIIPYVLLLLTFLNGWFRILLLSKRLRIVRRIAVAVFIWVPVIQIFVIFYMRRVAANEYDHACNKAYNDKMRRDDFICETKYPLLMLHGVGFRDFKYLNYWGRIPKNLIRNGATVFYGHQEALGTIEENGRMVRDKILEIVRLTGCEKVNIIAHSKGGLDARYTITELGMDPYVASLTTLSTPHRGSALADFAVRWLPDKRFRAIGRLFDRHFTRIGDKRPDFYTAMHQFTAAYAQEFNDRTPDRDGVYYQSYMSLMKSCFSHSLLSVPYLIMCLKDRKNDGLVTLDSARWGKFRGVFTNTRMRGISHGDMIDLTRADYKRFNVVEAYIRIVAELKEMGF